MPSNIAIKAENLSKSYDVFNSPGSRLVSLIFGRKKNQATFEAIKPISFQVEKGGFLGIVGQNGSGKSTLLQIICGILSPTSGSVVVHGRVAALLELGAGFNPEFSGRENARLNAQILGISGKKFDEVLPDIESFADIGSFIDQPVKTYSSGMFVRLAFAIQTCIDSDILIVDEALAVGDIFFRLKCYARLEELRKNGCTVILVTHSMEDILHYCDKALLLHHGEVLYYGDPAEAVNNYYALGQIPAMPQQEKENNSTDLYETNNSTWPDLQWVDLTHKEQTGDQLAYCTKLGITDINQKVSHIFKQFDTLKLYIEITTRSNLATPIIGYVIRTDKGVIVHGKNTAQLASDVPAKLSAGERVAVVFDIPLVFGNGEYLLDIGFASWPSELHGNLTRITMAEIESAAARHCVIAAATNFSIIPKGHQGYDAQPFYGLSDTASAAIVHICN